MEGLAAALGSDCSNGIADINTAEERKKEFGENKFATPPLATYWELFIATFEVAACSYPATQRDVDLPQIGPVSDALDGRTLCSSFCSARWWWPSPWGCSKIRPTAGTSRPLAIVGSRLLGRHAANVADEAEASCGLAQASEDSPLEFGLRRP